MGRPYKDELREKLARRELEIEGLRRAWVSVNKENERILAMVRRLEEEKEWLKAQNHRIRFERELESVFRGLRV